MSVPQSSRDRAEALRATLHAHNHRYYVLDDPQVSDAEYDALFRELQQLESDFPVLLMADSPTQRVGGAPRKMFAAVHHRGPMQSLNKAFDDDERRDLDRRGRDGVAVPIVDAVAVPTLDGGEVSQQYEQGDVV